MKYRLILPCFEYTSTDVDNFKETILSHRKGEINLPFVIEKITQNGVVDITAVICSKWKWIDEKRYIEAKKEARKQDHYLACSHCDIGRNCDEPIAQECPYEPPEANFLKIK